MMTISRPLPTGGKGNGKLIVEPEDLFVVISYEPSDLEDVRALYLIY
jgi:hypothetical protein